MWNFLPGILSAGVGILSSKKKSGYGSTLLDAIKAGFAGGLERRIHGLVAGKQGAFAPAGTAAQAQMQREYLQGIGHQQELSQGQMMAANEMQQERAYEHDREMAEVAHRHRLTEMLVFSMNGQPGAGQPPWYTQKHLTQTPPHPTMGIPTGQVQHWSQLGQEGLK